MVVFLLLLTIFTYFVVPTFVTPYLRARPETLNKSFAELERGLLAYAADHGGQFPPTERLVDYRRENKNLTRSRAFGITTYRVPAMTTPVAYVDIHDVGDPYAMPEQFAPPGYFVVDFPQEGWRVAVIFSAGPNLRYEIRNIEMKDLKTLPELEAALQAKAYDPASGLKGPGDIYRLIKIPLNTGAQTP